GGLHDNVSRKTKVIAQREQLLLGSIARSVFALGRIWKLRARTEHMTMRVHRASGDLETRPGWAWIPVEPARGLLKFHQRCVRHSVGFSFARIRSASVRQSGLRANSFVPFGPNSPWP